ncbi:hypothetical protein A2U01_0103449, partial [Trifolium medium]|nr:hypothetical protein [Trifolium medium]
MFALYWRLLASSGDHVAWRLQDPRLATSRRA